MLRTPDDDATNGCLDAHSQRRFVLGIQRRHVKDTHTLGGNHDPLQ